MKRHEWKFNYAANKLAEAAEAKKAWHSDRLKWWSDKKDEVMKLIKSEGIEIDESLAEQLDANKTKFSNAYANRGPSVGIRNDLVNDLEEAAGKVTEHRNKIREYDGWHQVMSSQGGNVFDLNQDDWMFFFGK